MVELLKELKQLTKGQAYVIIPDETENEPPFFMHQKIIPNRTLARWYSRRILSQQPTMTQRAAQLWYWDGGGPRR